MRAHLPRGHNNTTARFSRRVTQGADYACSIYRTPTPESTNIPTFIGVMVFVFVVLAIIRA